MDTLNDGDGSPGRASPVRTSSDGRGAVGTRAQRWPDCLCSLAASYPQLGIGPDLAALGAADLWGLYRLLCRFAGGA